jgi:rod shape determining protein RodA
MSLESKSISSGSRSQHTTGLIANLDWTLIGLFLILVFMGWFNLYSASFQESAPSMFDSSQEYGKQFIWIIICSVAAAIVLILDSDFFRTFAYHIFGIVMLLLVAVLLFGAVKNGAKSWFGIGSFGIQPSEFAKFATALALAKYLSSLNVRIKDPKTKIIAGAIVNIPTALILLQPDMGTVLVFVAFVFVLYREGLSGNYLLLGLMSIILAVISLLMKDGEYSIFGWFSLTGQYMFISVLCILAALILYLIRALILPRFRRSAYFFLLIGWMGSLGFILAVDFLFNSLASHQQERIEITLGLKEDPRGSGYNVNQAMSAIGSGGVSGKGYMHGTLSNDKYQHVPMQSTDFIFCSVGEEWGFIGSTVLIVAYILLLFRLIIVAERQRSKFTRIYGYSVACILFFHLMINVGMAIGLAPVIGIPLPFFSYGGSSLLGFTVLLFIFVKLDGERMDLLS